MTSDERFSVIILAGGFGKRLGQDKAGVALLERPLLHWTAERARAVSDDLVVVRRPDQQLPEPPSEDGWVECEDLRVDAGPLAGLEAGLPKIQSSLAVVIACDMPLVQAEVIRGIARACADVDVAMPVIEGTPQPLLSAYRPAALEAIIACLERGEGRVRAILPDVSHVLVDEEALRRFDAELESFFNINYPEDLERVAALLSARASG